MRFLGIVALAVVMLGGCGGHDTEWTLTVDRSGAALDDLEAVVSVAQDGRVVAAGSGPVRSTGRLRSQLRPGSYTVLAEILPCENGCMESSKEVSKVPGSPTCSLPVKVTNSNEMTVRLTVVSSAECSLAEV